MTNFDLTRPEAADSVFVFDIGGTFIKYALMTREADILFKGEVPTPMTSQEEFIRTLYEAWAPCADQAEGIALSIPGNVNADTGDVITPGSLTYNRNTNVASLLREEIQRRTGRLVPVWLENDGKAAALAEIWKGNLRGCRDGAVIVLGTGIGGGIVVDGKVHKGKDFFAGELSFLMGNVEESEFDKAMGTNASTAALTGMVAAAAALDAEEVDGYKVMELREAGNEAAVACFDLVCRRLSGLVYNLICLMNPERVLIGGGISRQPLLIQTIRDMTEQRLEQIRQCGFDIPGTEIMNCAHHNDSNLIGALYNYLLHETH